MNPTQFFRRRNLLRADRPRDCDFCVDDFGVDSFVVRKLNYIDVRELLLQSRPEPFRGVPLVEGVMNENEKFHS